MFETLDRLRKKSDSQKRKIAFSISFSFALIIFLVWVTVIFPDFRNRQKEIASHATSTSPTEGILSLFTSGFEQIGESFNEVKAAVYSLSTTSTYYNSFANPQYSRQEN